MYVFVDKVWTEVAVYPKLNVCAWQCKLFRTCQDVTYDLKCVEFEYEDLRHWFKGLHTV
jgi:hypothetical protein